MMANNNNSNNNNNTRIRSISGVEGHEEHQSFPVMTATSTLTAAAAAVTTCGKYLYDTSTTAKEQRHGRRRSRAETRPSGLTSSMSRRRRDSTIHIQSLQHPAAATVLMIAALLLHLHSMILVVQSWSLSPSVTIHKSTVRAATEATRRYYATPSSSSSTMASVLEAPTTSKRKAGATAAAESRILSSSTADDARSGVKIRLLSNKQYDNQQPWSMFLQHHHHRQQKRMAASRATPYSSSASITVGRAGARIASTTTLSRTAKEWEELLAKTTSKDRGILGFDVFELQAATRHSESSSSSSNSVEHLDEQDDDDDDRDDDDDDDDEQRFLFRSSTASSSSARSSFFAHPGVEEGAENAEAQEEEDAGFTWSHSPLSTRTLSKNGKVFAGGSSTSITASPSTTAFASTTTMSSSPMLQPSFILPAWFPWIPTKSQILSLKVAELKEACSQRGLLKTGTKAILQDRLWEWTTEQQHHHHVRLTGDYLTSWFEDMARQDDSLLPPPSPRRERSSTSMSSSVASPRIAKPKRHNVDGTPNGSTTPNSLEEWSRTVDLDKLMNKRQEIHRQKRQGKKPETVRPARKQPSDTDPKEYLSRLTKAMNASPSSPLASNIEVKEIYKASKQADQLGERQLSIQLLESLLAITPNDARVYRRLARMHSEQGEVDVARATLQRGLRKLPKNPWLWHGLGQLELSNGQTKLGNQCYQRAIREDPTFAHSYHAWGIYEYSQGHIASAMKILKRGVEYCPTNHRLHHALGDIYRGAKLLRDADRSYRRALQEGPPVSHGFAYTSLACVAYEQGDIEEARRWLYRAINLNNGRHAQGWLDLAELEEAEGNPQKALGICQASILQYEKELIESRQRYKHQRDSDRRRSRGNFEGQKGQRREQRPASRVLDESLFRDLPTKMEDVKNSLLKSIPPYRSGDKFLRVYRHWARLEEQYGTFESANRAHERASLAFPKSYQVTLDWAQYHSRLRNEDRARSLFVEACNKTYKSHADPYRLFAMFEMSHGNFQQARKILFRGAQAIGGSSDGGLGNTSGLAQLFVTWALAEWHLKNAPRAEMLFDHALRLTEAGSDGSELRSYILYCMALLEYQERDELYLAQHCIGLCLKENCFPGGNSVVWELWAKVAADMGNEHLEDQCLHESVKCTTPSFGLTSSRDLLKASDMETMMRQDPWHDKLQAARGMTSDQHEKSKDTFYSSLRLPRQEESLRRELSVDRVAINQD